MSREKNRAAASMRVRYSWSEEALVHHLWKEDGHVDVSVLDILSEVAPPGFENDFICDTLELIVDLTKRGASRHEIARQLLRELRDEAGVEEASDQESGFCTALPRAGGSDADTGGTLTVVFDVVDEWPARGGEDAGSLLNLTLRQCRLLTTLFHDHRRSGETSTRDVLMELAFADQVAGELRHRRPGINTNGAVGIAVMSAAALPWCWPHAPDGGARECGGGNLPLERLTGAAVLMGGLLAKPVQVQGERASGEPPIVPGFVPSLTLPHGRLQNMGWYYTDATAAEAPQPRPPLIDLGTADETVDLPHSPRESLNDPFEPY